MINKMVTQKTILAKLSLISYKCIFLVLGFQGEFTCPLHEVMRAILLEEDGVFWIVNQRNCIWPS